MRVAALYDIHANLPALQAVMDDIHRAEVDHVVVGGDVLPGPMPRETLSCLLDLSIPVRFIYGNGEVAVLEQIAGRDPAAVPEQYRPIIRWNAQQLDSEQQRIVASWPKTLRIDLADLGQILFCHATPRSENEIFTRSTPEERLGPVFADTGASLVVCGHTHMQFDRTVGKVRIVNAGSVGMPFGEPGAYWLLLGANVELRRTTYDVDAAAVRIRATQYPQAAEFAERNVRHPLPEAQMLELFSRAELK